MKLIIDMEKDKEGDLRNCMLLIEKRIHQLKEISKGKYVEFGKYKLDIKSEDTHMIKLVKVIYNELIDKFGKSVPYDVILMEFKRKEQVDVVHAIDAMMRNGEIYQPNDDFIAKL